jgi:hypothetical protein
MRRRLPAITRAQRSSPAADAATNTQERVCTRDWAGAGSDPESFSDPRTSDGDSGAGRGNRVSAKPGSEDAQ